MFLLNAPPAASMTSTSTSSTAAEGATEGGAGCICTWNRSSSPSFTTATMQSLCVTSVAVSANSKVRPCADK